MNALPWFVSLLKRLENVGSACCQFTIVNAYDADNIVRHSVRGGDTEELYLDLRNAHGWYNLERDTRVPERFDFGIC